MKKLGAENYLHVFEENEVAFDDLRLLTNDQLREMNIPIGPRARILNDIQKLKSKGNASR